MHIIFRLLLLVALFTTLSYSQGARGGTRTGGIQIRGTRSI
ncbi:unnamed protein product, partial [Rotaria sp. Silwood1]